MTTALITGDGMLGDGTLVLDGDGIAGIVRGDGITGDGIIGDGIPGAGMPDLDIIIFGVLLVSMAYMLTVIIMVQGTHIIPDDEVQMFQD